MDTHNTFTTEELVALFKNALEHQNKAEYKQAEEFYLLILKQIPKHADSLHYLGLIKHATGNNTEAITLLESAISITPVDADMHYNLGVVLQQSLLYDSALRHFLKAIELNPEYGLAHSNLYLIYKQLNNSKLSAKHCLLAYQCAPDSVEVKNNYGIHLREQGQFFKSIEIFKSALSISPNHYETLLNLTATLFRVGNTDEAINYSVIEKFANGQSRRSYGALLLHSNYNYRLSREELSQHHLFWGKAFSNQAISCDKSVIKSGQRMRIGYVSADFKKHSVAYFFESIIENHDRKKFEITCYSNVAKADEITLRIQENSEHWREVRQLSDEKLFQLIQNDGIDILVDLAGHTSRNRLALFSKKPAPVQVTYLGYPNTTGLKTMDYRFTDELCDPIGETEYLCSETLVRLENCFLCFKPDSNSPSPETAPVFKNKIITFGSFNNLAKINPLVISAWSKILLAVPNSRLLIKSEVFSDKEGVSHIISEFSLNGVNADRLILKPIQKNYTDHLALYREIDIALDTFPYNGTTTTAEALWMGVPVITLAGDSHLSRVGVSILSAVNHSELIAIDVDNYISKAVDLSQNSERLNDYHILLREQLSHSDFLDAIKFTHKLEKTYQLIWEKTSRN